MKKFNIAQVGSFDVENYGDLLFAPVFKSHITKRLDIDNIVLFAPKNCNMPFEENIKVYSVTELEKKHLEYNFDAIVVGGGDLIHLTKICPLIPYISKDSPVIYEALYMWILPVFVAVKYNIPIIFNGVGVPSEFKKHDREFVRGLTEAVDYISVRDELSKEHLLTCGTSKDITVIPDSVLSISKVYPKELILKTFESLSLPFDKDKKYVAVHINKRFSDENISALADELIKIKKEYDCQIVLVPIGYALGDYEMMQKLNGIYPDEFIPLTEKLSPINMLSVIVNSECYIGASLHGCITASAYGTKVMMLNYSKFTKIDGFLSLIGRSDCLAHDADETFEVFKNIINLPTAELDSLLPQIDKHFDKVAKIISDGKNDKPIADISVAMAETIYGMQVDGELFDLKDAYDELMKTHISLATTLHQTNLAHQKLINEHNALRSVFEDTNNSYQTLKTEHENICTTLHQTNLELLSTRQSEAQYKSFYDKIHSNFIFKIAFGIKNFLKKIFSKNK